jgi:hypothetical protein
MDTDVGVGVDLQVDRADQAGAEPKPATDVVRGSKIPRPTILWQGPPESGPEERRDRVSLLRSVPWSRGLGVTRVLSTTDCSRACAPALRSSSAQWRGG